MSAAGGVVISRDWRNLFVRHCRAPVNNSEKTDDRLYCMGCNTPVKGVNVRTGYPNCSDYCFNFLQKIPHLCRDINVSEIYNIRNVPEKQPASSECEIDFAADRAIMPVRRVTDTDILS